MENTAQLRPVSALPLRTIAAAMLPWAGHLQTIGHTELPWTFTDSKLEVGRTTTRSMVAKNWQSWRKALRHGESVTPLFVALFPGGTWKNESKWYTQSR